MQHFPFPASSKKGSAELNPKVDDTKVCMTLGHSNLCKMNFYLLTGLMQHFTFPASSEKGSAELTPKVDDTKGCMTLGNSNWTICIPQNLSLVK